MKKYFKAQVKRAKRVRELFTTLGIPSENEMNAILRMNLIRKNPVTQ